MISFSVLSILLIAFYINRNRNLILILGTPLIFYFLCYDLRNQEFVNDIFVINKVFNFTNYLFYGASLFLSNLTIIFFDNLLLIKIRKKEKLREAINYNNNRLIKLFYLFSILSHIGVIFNLSHVDYSFELLFKSPRDYEMIFGASAFFNYLYFTNVIALIICVYLTHNNVKLRFKNLICVSLIIISFFHGVKFTVFDTILFPFIFYGYLKRGEIGLILPTILIGFLLLFYWAFSSFIRGAALNPIEQIFSYILPNYYNLAFSIQEVPFQWDGWTLIVPDKMPSFFSEIYVEGPSGFILNDSYNMQTAYMAYYKFAWYLGPILFLLPIVIIRRLVIEKAFLNILNLFIITYIDYCLIFSFFFHAFTKTKYIYFFFLMLIVQKISKSNKFKCE